MTQHPSTTASEAHNPDGAQFESMLWTALDSGSWQRLVLAKPHSKANDLQRVVVRPVLLRGQTVLSFVYSHPTRDLTKNFAPQDGLAEISNLLAYHLRNAHLFTPEGEAQLLGSKKGEHHLIVPKTKASASCAQADHTSAQPAGPATPNSRSPTATRPPQTPRRGHPSAFSDGTGCDDARRPVGADDGAQVETDQ
jgi:hypothetical protein